MPQKWKKEESERLRGERPDQVYEVYQELLYLIISCVCSAQQRRLVNKGGRQDGGLVGCVFSPTFFLFSFQYQNKGIIDPHLVNLFPF